MVVKKSCDGFGQHPVVYFVIKEDGTRCPYCGALSTADIQDKANNDINVDAKLS